MKLIEMNSDHRDVCVCLKCRPVCRGRYTKEEWDALVANSRCKHCDRVATSHAGSHWHAGDVLAAGACPIRSLGREGVRSLTFEVGDGMIAASEARTHSSEYVFEE